MKRVRETLIKIGLDENFKIEIVNSTDKNKRDKYVKLPLQKTTKDWSVRERCGQTCSK